MRVAVPVVCACCLAGLALQLAAGQQTGTKSQVLARLQRRFASTEAFSCKFEQTKRVRQLEGDVKLRGDLLFQKPNSLKMRLTGDEAMEIYVNGRTAWIVDQEARDVQQFSLTDVAADRQLARLLPPFVLYNFQDLERQFSVAVRSGESRTTIVLTPKPSAGLPYRLVELEVDSLDRPQRALVQYANGDRIDTTFRAWERLPRVSPLVFDYVGK
jgi:outer membrane lipoprotein-sorting protein